MPLLPLNRLAPRLRRSVEGLNLELEEVFVSEKADDQHEVRPLSSSCCSFNHTPENLIICLLLDFPDFGYPRWPPGPRPRAEMQQRLPERALPGPPGSFPSVSLPVPLPAWSISSVAPKFSLSNPTILFYSITVSLPHGRTGWDHSTQLCRFILWVFEFNLWMFFCLEPADCEVQGSSPSLPPFPPEPSLFQPCSSSPRPNKTCSFLREPPEGCERVRVCEEAP